MLLLMNTNFVFIVHLIYLELHEVKLCSTRVHESVEVLVAGELRLDQATDVSLEKREDTKTRWTYFLSIRCSKM